MSAASGITGVVDNTKGTNIMKRLVCILSVLILCAGCAAQLTEQQTMSLSDVLAVIARQIPDEGLFTLEVKRFEYYGIPQLQILFVKQLQEKEISDEESPSEDLEVPKDTTSPNLVQK